VAGAEDPIRERGLIAMVFLSALCIGGFYATSLTWGRHTHYAMIEYWRWWLVHLWVEGFFEVFATAVIALLFTRLGLIRAAGQQRHHRWRPSSSCSAASSARCTTSTSPARRPR
jgi:nitric oxide reductase subunit B